MTSETRAKLRNFVGGEYVDAKSGRTSQVIDPSTGDVYAEAPVSGTEDVDSAFRAAQDAFPGWRDLTPKDRSLALLKLADAIEARAEEIVAVESRNTGKPLQLTADEEVPPMVDNIRFFAGASRILEGRSSGEYMTDHTSTIRREPIGVCAQVTPWNYPMMMAV
ncbi:MAG: betaine-aldehyde dehydrogenase, partial [Streptosporangiaceae bacterium]|nr:betaine-aldehyde dehydrogenase [Streptosporangiaceae bacterium]